MAKPRSTIVTDLISRITASVSNADTKVGSILRDIFVDPVATSLAEAYSRVQEAALAQSPLTAVNEDVVVLGESLQIFRKPAAKGAGTVRFFRSTSPPGDINIPLGTTVATQATAASSAVSFITVEAATMLTAQAASYLNPDTGKYEIEVAISAVQGGTAGNKPANTIVAMIDSISGIEGCYNDTETVGGTDKETYGALRSRILDVIQGNNLGTKAGYLTEVTANTDVEEATVVTFSDPDAVRTDVGTVDVFVKGTVLGNKVDTYSPAVAGNYPDFILRSQPWIYSAATGSVDIISSVTGSLSMGVDFSMVKDSGSYGGSIYGRDTVHWLVSIDGSYGSLDISYNYNTLIATLQAEFDSDTKHIVGADVLAKDAIPIGIDVAMTVVVTTGYDPGTIATNVGDRTQDFINALAIGEDISEALLIAEVLTITGVDDVRVPLTTFQSTDGTITRDADSNLSIPALYRSIPGIITISTV